MNKVKDLFDLIKPEIFNSVKMIEKSKLFGENWAQKHTKINIEKAKKLVKDFKIVEFSIDERNILNIHFENGIFIIIHYKE